MLSRGFKDQIYDIFQLLPPKLQVRYNPTLEADYASAEGAGGGPAARRVELASKVRGARAGAVGRRSVQHLALRRGRGSAAPGCRCHVPAGPGSQPATPAAADPFPYPHPSLARQVGVFSATLPPEALEITRKFMNKPVSGRQGRWLARCRGASRRTRLSRRGQDSARAVAAQGWLSSACRLSYFRRPHPTTHTLTHHHHRRHHHQPLGAHSGQARRADPGGYQAVLRERGEGGLEAGHAVRPVRDAGHHAERDLRQHPPQGARRWRRLCGCLWRGGIWLGGVLACLGAGLAARRLLGGCRRLWGAAAAAQLPTWRARHARFGAACGSTWSERRRACAPFSVPFLPSQVDWLTDKMRERDHTVSATHGDMDQNTRDVIMREFRSGSSRVLITTDLLARGIDVQQVRTRSGAEGALAAGAAAGRLLFACSAKQAAACAPQLSALLPSPSITHPTTYHPPTHPQNPSGVAGHQL